jgi:rhomboid family GlyGly-CTERM serine protease
VNSGQWWRIITYPLVHLSFYHLLLDAGGFLLLFSCLEEKRLLPRMFYLIGPGAGALLLSSTLDPSISQRGLSGLSGIAHGLMAISAVEMLRHDEQRAWGILSLTVVSVKSAYELWSGRVVFEFMHMGLCGTPLAAAHAGGVMGGLLILLVINFLYRNNLRPIQKKSSSTGQTLLCVVARALSRVFYRVRCSGLEHIPQTGPAVLVCNHVSFIDWLFIAGACRRPVHFVMHASYYRMPLVRRLFKAARAIPIVSRRENPAILRRAFREIGEVLQSGGLVCLFPEGSLTRNGNMNHFRPGIETIIRRNPVPVIPLSLTGLWGSVFSRHGDRFSRRLKCEIRRPVELAAGAGLPPQEVTAANLWRVVNINKKMIDMPQCDDVQAGKSQVSII